MACYHPISASWNRSTGEVVFWNKSHGGDPVELPCGQCVGCRSERARQWAVRCMHEASQHSQNVFATLTYAEEELSSRSLVYRDFQLFMKRLRRRRSACRIRFYMCGEYGERNRRPHFHSLLFGVGFPDALHLRGKGEYEEFTSRELDEVWGKGSCVFGQVTHESASYVARYMVVPRTVSMVTEDGEIVELAREFNQMSRRPGLGESWWRRFGRSDVVPDGQVVVEGRKWRAPRFYDKRMRRADARAFSLVVSDRQLVAEARRVDNSPERLAVREAVALAGLALKRRM